MYPTMKQLEFNGTKGWGGKRSGAGRPNKSKKLNHMKRETVDQKKPLHITQKLMPGLFSLRKKEILKIFRKSANEAKRFGFYVLHFSIQKDHLHYVAEVKSNLALGKGMRSLAGRFAKGTRKKIHENGGEEVG